jgi:hypothetical protein
MKSSRTTPSRAICTSLSDGTSLAGAYASISASFAFTPASDADSFPALPRISERSTVVTLMP